MTRKRTLLGVFLALVAAVVLLMLFVSRPTRAETLAAQVALGGTLGDVKSILGSPESVGYIGGLGGEPRTIDLVWTIEGERIHVHADEDRKVVSVAIEKLSLIMRIRQVVGLD